jgi:hypothetical protein
MAHVALAPKRTEAHDSRAARMAAWLLAGVGGFFIGLGVVAVVPSLPAVPEHGVGVLLIGVIPIAYGAVYAATARAVWRHHLWGLVVGLLLCVPPIWVALELAPDVFNYVPPNEPGETQLAILRWFAVGSIIPHALIVVGLLLGVRQFSKNP